jgi:glycosyltransferase involved in cell wall biosynthesis
MFLGLRALEARLSPDVIVAHHVEAAVQALALLRTPVVFFAHTDLGSELPTYGPQLVRSVLGTAGRALDHALLRRSAAVAVISRALHERFTTELPDILDKTAYVPTPWPVAPHAAEGERLRSRQWLGLDQSAHVLLYAGNLDRYQGIHTLLLATRTLALRHPRIALLVATESDARELREQATRLGLAARLHVTHLLGEGVRRRVHAAADVAVVPRLAPGGLPVKLLDALARGVPCAASPHACAGLSLRAAVSVAADESSEALGEAIHILLASSAMRVAFAARGRAHLGMEHAPERHLDALDALIAHATHSQRAHAAQHL